MPGPLCAALRGMPVCGPVVVVLPDRYWRVYSDQEVADMPFVGKMRDYYDDWDRYRASAAAGALPDYVVAFGGLV
jgi:hypothetical protein